MGSKNQKIYNASRLALSSCGSFGSCQSIPMGQNQKIYNASRGAPWVPGVPQWLNPLGWCSSWVKQKISSRGGRLVRSGPPTGGRQRLDISHAPEFVVQYVRIRSVHSVGLPRSKLKTFRRAPWVHAVRSGPHVSPREKSL